MTYAASINKPVVWISYIGNPVTTAVHFEKSLKKVCRVVTVGPSLSNKRIVEWKLEKLGPVRHDIVTDHTPDMGEVLRLNPDLPRPDLYLWVESGSGHAPRNIGALRCPTACYLIDSHLDLEYQMLRAVDFDFIFIAQREYLPDFRKINPRAFWLPLACDPELHCKLNIPKSIEVGFVGGVIEGSEREKLLQRLAENLPLTFERCYRDEMAKIFSASKLVFNNAVNDDLNMRFFEVLSTGTLLLSDFTRNSGQGELFHEGEEYACYQYGKLVETARFYLENEELRERIARRGQRIVHNAHTYDHRIEELLAVTLGGKADTFSAEELRERSLAGVPPFYEETTADLSFKTPLRSFVIPVLDYSPASEYNIITLLNDLSDIEGEVIVIFNGAAVGDELKNHPRITRHAIMKQNIGVARGWNVGLDMAEAEVVFIINADAHITSEAVEAVEAGLKTLPLAACAGPQGAFVDFSLCCDYGYLDKGSFGSPLEVDAVSGFFFAVNRRLFIEHGIQFENAFSPCYFEEWDIGLQIKKAGLKSYVVPTTAYDHHWSGTIAALRTIPYLGRDESSGEIQRRNRQLFLAKWRHIAGATGGAAILQSVWRKYLLQRFETALHAGDNNLVKETAEQLGRDYPDDATASAYIRMALFQHMKHHAGSKDSSPL